MSPATVGEDVAGIISGSSWPSVATTASTSSSVCKMTAAPDARTASRAADSRDSTTSAWVRRSAIEAVNPWRRDRRCRTIPSCARSAARVSISSSRSACAATRSLTSLTIATSPRRSPSEPTTSFALRITLTLRPSGRRKVKSNSPDPPSITEARASSTYSRSGPCSNHHGNGGRRPMISSRGMPTISANRSFTSRIVPLRSIISKPSCSDAMNAAWRSFASRAAERSGSVEVLMSSAKVWTMPIMRRAVSLPQAGGAPPVAKRPAVPPAQPSALDP